MRRQCALTVRAMTAV